MADMGNIISRMPTSATVLFASALFLAGFGLKAGLMPFHAWLPDAHPSAPAPVSAVLSGVVIKSIGVYALCRIFFNVLGLGTVKPILNLLIILGIISMVGAGLAALGQRDLKRLLAYSSVSQIGHIIFAIGLGTPLGFLGALFHLVNHSVIKSLLFLNSGAVVYSTGERDMEKLGGLIQPMPVTAATSVIGSMSVAGIPPFNGFWSKLIIIIAAIQAGRPILALILVLVSVLTLAYYLRMLRLVFFGKLTEACKEIKEAPALMCISMIILAGFCFGLGLLLLPGIRTVLLEPGKSFLLGPAAEVLENGLEYVSPILGK
ncbi:Hydrogenase-4 component B [subsurface metagenome]